MSCFLTFSVHHAQKAHYVQIITREEQIMTNRVFSKIHSRVLTILLAAITAAAMGCQGAPPRITIEDASAELSPALFGEGLVFLTIKNAGGKDTLTGVKVDIPGASADLHEMREGLMIIRKKMVIPSQGSLTLRPSESHIMIEDMPKDMKAGSSFTLTLVFQRSGVQQVRLTLKKSRMPQMPMTLEHHMK
jgi:copper(I)-binding protein